MGRPRANIDKDKLVKLINDRWTTKEVAIHFGVKPVTVRKYARELRNSGVNVRWGRKQPRRICVDDETLIKKRLDGMTNPEIARELGCSLSTIANRFSKMRKADLEVPIPYGPLSRVKLPGAEVLLQLKDLGLNNAQIARAYCCTIGAVTHRLQRAEGKAV